MGILLKIILIFFAIIWIARFVFRLAFGRFIKNVQEQARQMQEQAEEQYRQQYEPPREEGEVYVKKDRSSRQAKQIEEKKIITDDDGEYVDFEDVD